MNRSYVLKLKDYFDSYEDLKDEVLDLSRKINKESKTIIYSVIRNDYEQARSSLNRIRELVENMRKYVEMNSKFLKYAESSYQEYAEAEIFFQFVMENRIPTHEELGITEESYVFGLMDFTGELLRKSLEEMIEGSIEFAYKSKKTIEEIYLSLLEINFKNYELRRKLDYVASNINRLNDYIFNYNAKKV